MFCFTCNHGLMDSTKCWLYLLNLHYAYWVLQCSIVCSYVELQVYKCTSSCRPAFSCCCCYWCASWQSQIIGCKTYEISVTKRRSISVLVSRHVCELYRSHSSSSSSSSSRRSTFIVIDTVVNGQLSIISFWPRVVPDTLKIKSSCSDRLVVVISYIISYHLDLLRCPPSMAQRRHTVYIDIGLHAQHIQSVMKCSVKKVSLEFR